MLNQSIIVLGMHRSGTSALAGVLSLLGITPGDTLLPAMEGINPKGFWEHAEIVTLHDQLLAALDSSWDDESPLPHQWWQLPISAIFQDRIIDVLRRDFDNLTIWLIKDPRMCRLLPMWHEIFCEISCQPSYVLSLRSPVEVAHSLRIRNDLADEASCLLWLAHLLEAEFQTRGQSRVFVTYEHLLNDWRGVIANIEKNLSLTWPVAADDAAPEIDAFLDASLRHHADNATLPDHPVCRLAQKGFELLSAPSPDPVELNRLHAQAEELVNLVTPWSKRLRHSENSSRTTIAHLESEKAALQADVKRIKGTVSWQITKPLRFIWNTLLKLLPGIRQRPNIQPSVSQHLPANTNEGDSYVLLLKHFEPHYKDRTNGYIDTLLAIEHYRGRLNYLRNVIGAERFHPKTRVLISGYGAGSEIIAAREAGLGEIHGIEVEKIWMEVTQKRLEPMPNVHPTHYDGSYLPYSDAQFDMLLSGHVIEHTNDPQLYLSECMRVLSAEGCLSLEFPHRYHHTELHTRLPSLEWLPRNIRDSVLRVLSGRFSPLSVGVKSRYASIVSTRLQQISMGSVRDWLKSSGYSYTILDTTKAAPGIIRCVIRKEAGTSTN